MADKDIVWNMNKKQEDYIRNWWNTFECPEEADLLEAVNNAMDMKFIDDRDKIINWVEFQKSAGTIYYTEDIRAMRKQMNTDTTEADKVVYNGCLYSNCLWQLGLKGEDKRLDDVLYNTVLNMLIEGIDN